MIDVAVCEPQAGAVGSEGDDGVAICGQEDDVPAWRVIELEVEVFGVRGEVGVVYLSEDREVVAVEVDLSDVEIGSSATFDARWRQMQWWTHGVCSSRGALQASEDDEDLHVLGQ